MVISGAGPAGSFAAYQCTSAGLRTLLLERCFLPRYKCCAGGVLDRALKIPDFGIPNILIEKEIRGLTMVWRNVRKEFRFDERVAITVKRSAFDAFLTKKAEEAGCELWDGTKAVAATEYQDRVRIESERGAIESRHLIVAEGSSSRLANQLFGRFRQGHTAIGMAVDCEFPGDTGTSLEVHFIDTPTSSINRNPYFPINGWIFPHRHGANVGVVGYRTARPLLEKHISTLIARLSYGSGPISKGTVTAHPLPLAPRRKVSSRLCLAVGDSAGFVNPLTGEGMTYALTSGSLAADAIYKAITAGSPISNYDRECANTIMRDLKAAATLGPILHWLIGKVDLKTFMEEFACRDRLMDASKGIAKGNNDWRLLLKHTIPSFLPLLVASRRRGESRQEPKCRVDQPGSSYQHHHTCLPAAEETERGRGPQERE